MQVPVDRAQAINAHEASSLQAVHAALSAAGACLRRRSTAALWSSPAMSRARDAVAASEDPGRVAA